MILLAQKRMFRTWIEVDVKNIKHNFNAFRDYLPKNVKIMAVVKSNAYGHSLIDFSQAITAAGVDWLAIDSAVEGFALRREGIKTPILILGYILPSLIAKAVENNLSLTISNFEALDNLLSSGETANVHLKVDTGMHRQGFLENQKKALIQLLLKNNEKIDIEGIYSHLAAAKKSELDNFSQRQIQAFKGWLRDFKANGFNPLAHLAATAGAIVYPQAHFDLVRLGIGLYGLWPDEEMKSDYESKISLKPILSWKTIISEIKKIPKGERIGYDLTCKLERESVIAICPIGYWHGFPRLLSNKGRVLVGGVSCPVLGRVCMDMIIIDITDAPKTSVGDEVVLIGKSGREQITSYEIAKLAATSHYEIVTRLNPLIKKFYI